MANKKYLYKYISTVNQDFLNSVLNNIDVISIIDVFNPFKIIKIVDTDAAKIDLDKVMSDNGYSSGIEIMKDNNVAAPNGWNSMGVSKTQTVNSIAKIIHTLTLDDNKTYLVKVSIVGTKNNGSLRTTFVKIVTCYRNGGGAIILGSATTIYRVGSVDYSVNFTVSGNDMRVNVHGDVSTVVNWKCAMQYLEQ